MGIFDLPVPSASRLNGAYDRKTSQDLRDAGGVADGTTNNGPAMLSLLAAAKAGKTTMPYSLSSDPVGNKTIFLPAGDYLITDIGGVLGQEAMTGKITGLRFVGQGAGITRVIFKPSTAGALLQNDFWLNIQFENIGFYAATAGCTFMHSSTTHNAQRYQFINCYWHAWKYTFYLEGNNNNSEFCFVNCHSNATEATGAFLRIPSTGSDQFLNYWFYGMTHWTTSAPFIDADKGGHFNVYGLDASNWGGALTEPGYLFKLNGATHAHGVCSLQVDVLRVEAKNNHAALLYTEWPQGNIRMTGVDWSSQLGSYTYGNIIKVSYVNVDGAILTISDSVLAGGVEVAFSGNDWSHLHSIAFRDCTWYQKASPTDVVTYTASTNPLAQPPVHFERCRPSPTYANALGTTGAAVWDATVGYRGQLLQTLTPRVVSLRGVYGAPIDGTVPKAILPVGALITEFQVLAPAGAVSEGDGGSWTLATTDGSPVTIATATVAGPMTNGFDVKVPLAVPFSCDTTARATVTVTPSGVGQNNSKALLLIKGYW